MSSMDTEAFPRGGKRIFTSSAENRKRKNEENLFTSEKVVKNKKPRKEKSSKNTVLNENSFQAALKLNGTLSYKKMQDGMTMLACVRQISDLIVHVEFAGLTYGSVAINRISDVFTKRLTDQLKEEGIEPLSLLDVLKVGQMVTTKIIAIGSTNKGHSVQASINPKDVNAGKSHNNFKKGATVWGCVTSELDHGFELSLGVKNCRVFLPSKNVDASAKFAIGQPLFCAIHKVESSPTSTILTVSTKKDHLEKASLADDFNLLDVNPGLNVKFLVEEVNSHGAKGHFMENCFGYLDQTQLFSKKKLEHIKEGSTLLAQVLFVEPITKVSYLTLRGTEILPEATYEIGKLLTCEIQGSVIGGLSLTLSKDSFGIVTNKRLLNGLNLQKTVDSNASNIIRTKYPIGSQHQCRILDFNIFHQLYICTFEKKILNEKQFSVNDLKLGQIVTVKIEKNISNGLVVRCGHVQGFIPNLHISQNKFSKNIKTKYPEGTSVTAKVLTISNNNVIFTLKQSMLESESSLTNIEDAIPKTQHVGFVVQTNEKGALISFYGDVKGWLSSRILNKGERMDPREYFFIGQVVNVWVNSYKKGRLRLSLTFPVREKNSVIKIGAIKDAVISGVQGDNILVKIGKFEIEAVIPTAHLAFTPEIANWFLKTCTIGSTLQKLMCVKNKDVPVLSRRERIAFEKLNMKVLKYEDLKTGEILRCSFEQKAPTGIYVTTPIADFKENIFISHQHMYNPDQTFDKYELINAKIVYINHAKRQMILKIDAQKAPKLDKTLDLLDQNLQDLAYITNFASENKWKIAQYKLGERVKCKVKEMLDNECWVTLPNGARGFCNDLKQKKIKKGTVVEGVVVNYNFGDDFVNVCLRNDLKQRINPIQDGIIHKSMFSSCMASIFLFTNFYAVGVLKDTQCNRQLVYLPLIFNSNNVKENKCKVLLCRKTAFQIIAVPKKFALTLVQTSTNQEQEKLIQKPIQKHIKNAESTSGINHEINNGSKIELDDDTDSELEDDSDIEMEVDAENNENDDFKTNITEISDESENETNENELMEEVKEEILEDDSVDIDTKEQSVDEREDDKKASTLLLSGVASFYSADSIKNEVESSSDEETEEKEQNKKKKKLSSAERAELTKQEEERIRKIEQELADSSTTPQTADHFDRLLLANPNSSALWLKYIAMHVAAAELTKARAVGRKALETINISLDNEKLNIWLALLNLENMFGTKESLDAVFDEAIKTNDMVEIYLNTIKMLAASGKLGEMEEKIKKIRAKEKQNIKMWLEVSQVYYSLGKFKEARNLKDAALKSILDKRRQFELIVRTGVLEFQYGDFQHAISNFETILNCFPSKLNIWIIYIDQMIKKGKIDEARSILERAANQKFPIKQMKSIFQKFVQFEEQYGNLESINAVKNKAKDFVKNHNLK